MKKYQIKNAIGSGNFSTVYSAEGEDNEKYAVKIMKSHHKIAAKQAQFLSKMNHPNVIKFIQFQQNQQQSKLVFERVGINTLQLYQSHSYGLRQEQIKCILFQTALGLAYIHSFGIVHRDIKPENLLIDKNNALVKIIDFGLAINDKKISTDYIATRWYRAPQNLLQTKEYTTAIDVFSLGCVIVQLYLGSPLFPGSNNIDQIYKIFNILGTPTILNWSAGYDKMKELGMKINAKTSVDLDIQSILAPCDPKLIDLIKKMLILNPKDRIKCKDIVKDQYFKDVKKIIPHAVYQRYSEDFSHKTHALSFSRSHKILEKQNKKSTDKHLQFSTFRSQQPISRQTKCQSIDSVQSNPNKIDTSLIKSVGNSVTEIEFIKKNKYMENTKKILINNIKLVEKQKRIQNQLGLDRKVIKRPKLVKNPESIHNLKNSTEKINDHLNHRYGFTKIEKIKQSYDLEANKQKQSELALRNRIGRSPNILSHLERIEKSPKYPEQVKHYQTPKIIQIQKKSINISPSQSFRMEGRKNMQNKVNFVSPSHFMSINNSQRIQKSMLRSSDQGRKITISPTYRKQSTLVASPSIPSQHYYKGMSNEGYLRKSPQITSKNYNFKGFQLKAKY